MSETLLIHYKPSSPDQTCWALINEQGNLTTKLSHGPLSDISSIAKGRRATVLLDGACVSLDAINIPSQNKQRQLQAVPFAMEDQLASDIDDMHFALGKRQEDQNIPVVSINKNLLEKILADFKQAEIKIEILSVDIIALPFEASGWTILIDNENTLIKSNEFTGYYCDRDNLSAILTSLLNKLDSQPETLHFYHETNDANAAELIKDTQSALSIKTYEESPFSIFAKNIDTIKLLNLLQGEYTPKRESNIHFKPWKAVAALIGIWLILQLVYAGIEANQLKQKNADLRSQIEKEFKRANPGAKKFNNMRKRMERMLKELHGGGDSKNKHVFLDIMSDAAPVLSKNDKVNIRGIAYRNKHIDMDLQADSLQTLESIKSQLSAIRNLKIVLSTSVEKNKVKGRLRLEREG